MTTALITGASSGIGAEFARQLASRGTDVVLVARSRDRLQQLAEELQERYEIRATVLAGDLTRPEDIERVYEETEGRGTAIDLLVNNAGFGDYGQFAESDRAKILSMVQLNVMALVDLTHRFLQPMRQRGSGCIVNVGSIASFQALPYFAVYAATKAFVLSFSEALWAENDKTGVKILAICPGPTDTNFFEVSGSPPSNGNSSQLASPETVVREAIAALDRDTACTIAGGLVNQAIATLPRLFPRDVLVRAIEQQFRPKSREN